MNVKKLLCSLALSASIFSFSTTTQANVLNGAKQFNGHYYKNFEMGLSWKDAKKFCESMGGHLATAENFDENAMIQQMVDVGGKKEYFIGGYKDERNIWKWVTGGIITDANWASGEPGSSSPLMTMTRKGDAKWSTSFFWGDHEYPFICEWDSEESAHDSTM